jgi:hypothetical protein
MSNPTENPYQPAAQWPDQPQQHAVPQYNVPPMPPQKPKTSKLKRFGLPVGLLLLGLVIGGASGASAVPDPVEVVKEVPGPERTVTKEVKVEVPKTPQACLTAIDNAESIIQSSGRVVGIFSEILDAVKTLNVAGIEAANPKIDAETATLNELRPKYQIARDTCRASK